MYGHISLSLSLSLPLCLSIYMYLSISIYLLFFCLTYKYIGDEPCSSIDIAPTCQKINRSHAHTTHGGRTNHAQEYRASNGATTLNSRSRRQREKNRLTLTPQKFIYTYLWVYKWISLDIFPYISIYLYIFINIYIKAMHPCYSIYMPPTCRKNKSEAYIYMYIYICI